MKTHLFKALVYTCAVLGTAYGAERESAKLEVHEWGTMTMASGTDGVALHWYQPGRTVAELPPFVQHNPFVGGKGIPRTLDRVRMETPVIYFYPEKPVYVDVSVEFKSGRITEWFPAPKTAGSIFGTLPEPTVWSGDLLPPNNMEAASQVPKITGTQGAHYGHAREVPAAWYFRRNGCVLSVSGLAGGSSLEKFIFYRGAGDSIPPLQANSLESGRLKLLRFDPQGEPLVAFALQVEGTRARWARMPDLPARTNGPTAPAPISEVRLEGAAKSLAQVTAELGAEMTKALGAAGLSPEEAKAMVATWSDLWFQENGSRIFVLLPRAWIDSVLPLAITPTPRKLTRVFVGRYETFTPEQEQAMLALLDPRDQTNVPPVKQFQDLKLGRFANAALERAKTMLQQRADFQFEALEKASGLQPATAAR